MSLCPTAPLYRQREFHQSALWRILVDHGEDFLKTYDSRYEESHGPLPPPSAKVMDKLLRCGDPRYGLTLFHCPECKIHMAVPFSCKTRVCPSCVNRRAECLSHSLAEKLPEGENRHLVVTLPKKMGLRKRFQLDTRLHRQIVRLIHRVIGRWMSRQVGCHRNRREERERARPGIIMAPQGASLRGLSIGYQIQLIEAARQGRRSDPEHRPDRPGFRSQPARLLSDGRATPV